MLTARRTDGSRAYVLCRRHQRQQAMWRASAPPIGAEASFNAVTSNMISKGSGSQRGVSAYERSLMRSRKSPDGLNVTTRRAETMAGIPVFGLRAGRSFFDRTWKEPKDLSLRSSPKRSRR